MMLASPIYAPPIRRHQQAVQPDYEKLEAAVALAGEGRARESVQKVFEHLFPTATIPDLTLEPYRYVQGSARATARLEGDELVVTVPLVQLPAGGRAIAALRYIVTELSGAGRLHQPRLHGENVVLEFRDKLTRLHPAKVVEVLREMPLAADNSDDWLIGQFGALPLERGSITPLDDDEAVRAEAVWRSHWNDVDALFKESQRKRSVWFLGQLASYTVSRIRFAVPLCGILSARLAESAATFDSGQENPSKREAALAKCVQEMKAVTSEELRRNLGHAEYALSPLDEGSPALLKYFFAEGEHMKTIDQLRKSGQPLDAGLALVGIYTVLLARFSWSDEVRSEFESGLAQASGKPWREAAALLFAHAQGVLVAKFGGAGAATDEPASEPKLTSEAVDGSNGAG